MDTQVHEGSEQQIEDMDNQPEQEDMGNFTFPSPIATPIEQTLHYYVDGYNEIQGTTN